MKKYIVFILTAFIVITASNVFANYDFWKPYFDMHMTDKIGSDEVVTEFNINQRPILYLDFGNTYINLTGALWESPNDKYYISGNFGIENELWLPFPNCKNCIEAGEWNVYAGSLLFPPDPLIMTGHTKFAFTPSVVPEPISSILFITGGITLAIRKLKFWKK